VNAASLLNFDLYLHWTHLLQVIFNADLHQVALGCFVKNAICPARSGFAVIDALSFTVVMMYEYSPIESPRPAWSIPSSESHQQSGQMPAADVARFAAEGPQAWLAARTVSIAGR
jgi:hypothetical protein